MQKNNIQDVFIVYS